MVSPFIQPDMTTQNAVEYKAAIDAAVSVLAGAGAGFATDDGGDSDMSVRVGIGVLFNRGTGNRIVTSPQTATIAAPASNAWIVRGYVDESGVLSLAYGASAASPVAPAYPPGSVPVFRVSVPSGTTQITNSMLVDERAWNSGYGTLKNTFLITSSTTFACPAGAKFLRITAAGGGGGGGGGYSTAADAAKYGGGGGGSAASVISRLFAPGNLTIVIGAGGAGGPSGSVAGSTDYANGSSGGTTSITGTGANSGLSISCAGGSGGVRAVSTPANGAGGAGGAAGTGTAGTTGETGTTTAGGAGAGVGASATMAPGGAGAAWASTGRTGYIGTMGSGGGGASGYGGAGGSGGNGFVLIEVF